MERATARATTLRAAHLRAATCHAAHDLKRVREASHAKFWFEWSRHQLLTAKLAKITARASAKRLALERQRDEKKQRRQQLANAAYDRRESLKILHRARSAEAASRRDRAEARHSEYMKTLVCHAQQQFERAIVVASATKEKVREAALLIDQVLEQRMGVAAERTALMLDSRATTTATSLKRRMRSVRASFRHQQERRLEKAIAAQNKLSAVSRRRAVLLEARNLRFFLRDERSAAAYCLRVERLGRAMGEHGKEHKDRPRDISEKPAEVTAIDGHKAWYVLAKVSLKVETSGAVAMVVQASGETPSASPCPRSLDIELPPTRLNYHKAGHESTPTRASACNAAFPRTLPCTRDMSPNQASSVRLRMQARLKKYTRDSNPAEGVARVLQYGGDSDVDEVSCDVPTR